MISVDIVALMTGVIGANSMTFRCAVTAQISKSDFLILNINLL